MTLVATVILQTTAINQSNVHLLENINEDTFRNFSKNELSSCLSFLYIINKSNCESEFTHKHDLEIRHKKSQNEINVSLK